MRGHQQLIDLRSRGVRPAVVFLNDYRSRPAVADAVFDGQTVEIDGDDLSLLDLRFLVGLTVSTGASTEQRARDILQACKAAGAAAVAVCHIPAVRAQQQVHDYIEIWKNEQ